MQYYHSTPELYALNHVCYYAIYIERYLGIVRISTNGNLRMISPIAHPNLPHCVLSLLPPSGLPGDCTCTPTLYLSTGASYHRPSIVMHHVRQSSSTQSVCLMSLSVWLWLLPNHKLVNWLGGGRSLTPSNIVNQHGLLAWALRLFIYGPPEMGRSFIGGAPRLPNHHSCL